MKRTIYFTRDHEMFDIVLIDNNPASARKPRLYHGGLAGCVAITVTHPLDLLKANLQTAEKKTSILSMIRSIAERNGIAGFYKGLSASLFRQMTYTLARFGVYEYGKDYVQLDTFAKKVGMAFFAGLVGAFVGTPSDMINVRMQNDSKLPLDKRRNYKHIFDGIYRVIRYEGPLSLFSGAGPNLLRGGCMTVGQLACYDQIKMLIMKYVRNKDDIYTHLSGSTLAGIIAVTITHPVDVIKTRAMNARPGQFKGLLDLVKQTAAQGPQAFAKGFIPSTIRMVPVTVITFIAFEELRTRFGIDPPQKPEPPPEKDDKSAKGKKGK